MQAKALAGLGADARTEKKRAAQMRAIVWASVIGTTVEWYDFLIYGAAAALVFNRLFFPSFDPFVGTLAAFGAYAVGFVARPFGGALFGHFGDRTGQRGAGIGGMDVLTPTPPEVRRRGRNSGVRDPACG